MCKHISGPVELVGQGGRLPPSFLTHSSTLEYSTVPNKGLDYVSPPQFLRGSTGPVKGNSVVILNQFIRKKDNFFVYVFF